MPLTVEQRFTANFLHHVQKMSVSLIAIAMIADEREVQDWIDVGEDYIAGEKPRRRPKRETEAASTETTAPAAPKTRARTASASSEPKPDKTKPAEEEFVIEPPPRRGEEGDREGFAPGQAA